MAVRNADVDVPLQNRRRWWKRWVELVGRDTFVHMRANALGVEAGNAYGGDRPAVGLATAVTSAAGAFRRAWNQPIADRFALSPLALTPAR